VLWSVRGGKGLIQVAYFATIYDYTVFQNCKMNDISVVLTSQVSTASTLTMLDRLNITIIQLTSVGQSVYDTGVYNKIALPCFVKVSRSAIKYKHIKSKQPKNNLLKEIKKITK
jgi:3-deoxy-D-manno-octulosonate 8-phosphate phosphatase KdsC-like HAD superfamily phosphatase